MNALALTTNSLSKHFGALKANDGVSIALYKGTIHGLLGPNGAGKSTLINLLAGETKPTAGQVFLHDGDTKLDVSRRNAHQRARAGVGRSFQRSNLFLNATVVENVLFAARANHQTLSTLFSTKAMRARCDALAQSALQRVGLRSATNTRADALSHGAQRQLEIAMVLATNPKILLLDEPLAGMGTAESADMVALLATLRCDYAMLLVEHDMQAIFTLADTITVMVEGAVIATGNPVEIRANSAVQAAYLGENTAP
jgi:branched-chain amino acid transport system ATP-binding protein